jgi:acyl-CoA reductase-like NAD-dependent aldehyde dehydrogenase
MGFGVGAGAAAGVAAAGAAGVWGNPSGAIQSTTVNTRSSLLVVVILASSLLPNGVLQVVLVEETHDSEKTDRDSQQHKYEAAAHGTG